MIRVGHGSLAFAYRNGDGAGFSFVPYAINGGISMAANLREALRDDTLRLAKWRKVQVLLDSPVVMVPIDEFNRFTISADANKLLVPSYPQQKEGETTEDYQQRVEDEYYNTSSISGMFKSFGDAPGGFKEELEEINWSVGAEYVYNDKFSVRAGYHHESENKGNRKYFTVGAGFRMSAFTLDCGYVIATAKSNPLDQTLRFTLGFDMDGLKDLFKRR